jgi:hypothetical protein
MNNFAKSCLYNFIYYLMIGTLAINFISDLNINLDAKQTIMAALNLGILIIFPHAYRILLKGE